MEGAVNEIGQNGDAGNRSAVGCFQNANPERQAGESEERPLFQPASGACAAATSPRSK